MAVLFKYLTYFTFFDIYMQLILLPIQNIIDLISGFFPLPSSLIQWARHFKGSLSKYLASLIHLPLSLFHLILTPTPTPRFSEQKFHFLRKVILIRWQTSFEIPKFVDFSTLLNKPPIERKLSTSANGWMLTSLKFSFINPRPMPTSPTTIITQISRRSTCDPLLEKVPQHNHWRKFFVSSHSI